MMRRTASTGGGLEARPSPISNRPVCVAAGLIVAAGLLAYRRTFSVPFLLDDSLAIVGNPSIRNLWSFGSVLSPPSDVPTGGRPIVNLSFALNYAVGGTAVWGYHLVNLVIHVAAGLTLFGLVRRTLQCIGRRRATPSDDNSTPLAFTVATLWTVHPLLTESVTYLSQRAESLMGLFYLVTLYSFVRATEVDASRVWLSLSVIACGCGMATKETMVTAPLVALFYDRVFVAPTVRAALKQRRWYYAGLAATWLVLLGLMRSGLSERGVGFGFGPTWWHYALTECKAVLLYLRLCLWPTPLCFDYGVHLLPDLPTALPFIAGLLLALGATIAALRQRPAVGVVASFFFILLAPTSSVVPIALQPFAENRAYLPAASVVVLFVVGLHAMLGRRSFAIFGLCGLFLVGLTIRRNETYRSESDLWADTARQSPDNPRAHDNWGIAELKAGRPAEALVHFQQAEKINAHSIVTQNGLGDAYALLQRWPEAAAHYTELLRLQPANAAAQDNLGLALLQLGKISEAIDHFTAALEVNPDYISARRNLADALRIAGRFREALPNFQRALELAPTDAMTRNKYGVALAQSGAIEAAAQQFEMAARDDPKLNEPRANLAALHRAYPSLDAPTRHTPP